MALLAAWPSLAQATLPPVQGAQTPPELIQARQAGLFSVDKPPSSRPHPQDAPALTPTGEWHIPVILVSFLGEPPAYPPERFKTLLFDTTGLLPHGSMAEYYRDVSRGQLRVTGDIVGWYALPESASYYANSGYGLGRLSYPHNLAGLVTDAVARADSAVDFSKYDRNKDGEVDYLLVVHTGLGAEAGAGNRNLLWSANSSLSGPWEFVTPYQTNDSLGGHTVINRFSVLPERSWIEPDSMAEVGPYCHEFGHGLGWPDLYDASVIGGGTNVGPGNWCIMSSGAYGGDDRHPSQPTRPCAWAMKDAGWLPLTNVTASGLLRFPPVEGPDAVIYRLWWQGDPWYEDFLVENRQQTGHDSGLPGAGLLVYHVDENIIETNRWQNRINSSSTPGLRVEEADGGYQLMGTFDRGTDGDPFPGSTHNTRFADDTQPSTRTFDGRHTNISLSGIESDGYDMFAWAQVTPSGWSAPSVTRLSGAQLQLDGTRVLTPTGVGDFDFIAANSADSSRVYTLSLQRGSRWGFPVRVSSIAGASEAAWSEAMSGPRLALWTDPRSGGSQIYYRTWDGVHAPGPEVRATFSPDLKHKPAAAWFPDGRLLLMWLDRTNHQLMFKIFVPGQEAQANEYLVAKPVLIHEIDDFTLASTGNGRFAVFYTVPTSVGSAIYTQHYEASIYWSSASRLSYGNVDERPVTQYMPGGVIRCSWIENGGTLFPIDAVDYDPVIGTISASQYEAFVSTQPLSAARVSPAPAGAPVAVVAEASEPPNDRLQFGEMESDGVWDAGLGKINGSVNVTGADPFVDVWDDGSIHVYWIRSVPGGMEMGVMSRGATVAVPVAVGPPPGAALGPRISVVPNPAAGLVTLSWGGEAPTGARLAVYSVAGRLLARSAAGARALKWDGRDALGARVAAGIYMVRLEDESGRNLGSEGKLVWLK
jgi:immune inhibitor A